MPLMGILHGYTMHALCQFYKSYIFQWFMMFFVKGGLVKNFRIMVMESIFDHISQFIFAYLHVLWINVD